MKATWVLLGGLAVLGCDDDPSDSPEGDAGLAEGIYSAQGDIRPNATAEQRATFERGEQVAVKRFTPAEGLGPKFNVTFCAACHEKPEFGGSAGRYRDFYIRGQALADGFVPGGDRGGVLAAYNVDGTRPMVEPTDDTFTLRNPIPFFGVGLIAELPEEAILANADPDDEDGDGISGRPNYDRGFVGRFGRKAQTVSIEGFIRGPLNNHLGLTSNPLSEALKAQLPVPSQTFADNELDLRVADGVAQTQHAQAAAPEEPLSDGDGVPDPEFSEADLFDLVSWAMLLGAPQPAPMTEQTTRGRTLFYEIGCGDCHKVLSGPRGALPLYSDLLLHDMGDALDDGTSAQLATGSEFRTQPLWGLASTGPYLHDGRADTVDQAIRMHGGEGLRARDAYEDLAEAGRDDILAFLNGLGGADQRSEGLVRPNTPIPAVGAPGGPETALDADGSEKFLAGRAIFDRDQFTGDGLGPVFNGDSCRACHFDPVIGGAGPLGVNAMRHGMITDNGEFRAHAGGTGLAKLAVPGATPPLALADSHFEPRQTPTVFGLGALAAVSEETIVAGADPTDANADGIRGVARVLVDGSIGRFGWKSHSPSPHGFARDGLTGELGLTMPPEDVPGGFLGATEDDDDVPDPEVSLETIDNLAFYIAQLAAPRPKADVPEGRAVFEQIGCDGCHVPRLDGLGSDVDAYTDLLLHVVTFEEDIGIEDGDVSMIQFRTPPLWGLSDTAPYMHDGDAATIADAITFHAGEAEASVDAYEALSDAERSKLLEFLGAL